MAWLPCRAASQARSLWARQCYEMPTRSQSAQKQLLHSSPQLSQPLSRSKGIPAVRCHKPAANCKFPEWLGGPERRPVQEDSSIFVMFCQRGRTSTMSKFFFQVVMAKETDYHFCKAQLPKLQWRKTKGHTKVRSPFCSSLLGLFPSTSHILAEERSKLL